jgi:hypothetical protein
MTFRHKEKPKAKPSGLHAYVCTPAYDGKVDSDFAQSLAESAFCAPLYGIRITAGVIGNGAFIELARNIFAKKMLDEFPDATHLFFIDADLKFEPRAFIGLLQANLPICAGVYRRRQEPVSYPFVPADNPDGGGLWFVNDWLQCNRVPTGFLCISRQVLIEMAEDAKKLDIAGQNGPVPWLFYTKIDDGNRFVGEDFAFCDDYVRKYKQPIPVWSNFNFKHGGYEGNLFEHLTSEVDKANAAKAATSSAA